MDKRCFLDKDRECKEDCVCFLCDDGLAQNRCFVLSYLYKALSKNTFKHPPPPDLQWIKY